MFRKNKTTAKAASGNDLNTLLDVFDKIISGEISHTGESPADITLFENPEVANKFNEVVETYKRFNNNFVMRLNEAMESIGDNSYVKNMRCSHRLRLLVLWESQDIILKNLSTTLMLPWLILRTILMRCLLLHRTVQLI